MRVYANEMSGRVDRLEQRLSGVEHRSAPPTPQSTISVSDSQSPAQNKPDSSDVDSNPDEAEIALEVGESLDTRFEVTGTCTCTCTYNVSLLFAARRERAAAKQEKRERKKRRLDELVTERLTKKKKETEDPLTQPPPDTEQKANGVKQEPDDKSLSQVGVFISINGVFSRVRWTLTRSRLTRTVRGMVRA